MTTINELLLDFKNDLKSVPEFCLSETSSDVDDFFPPTSPVDHPYETFIVLIGNLYNEAAERAIKFSRVTSEEGEAIRILVDHDGEIQGDVKELNTRWKEIYETYQFEGRKSGMTHISLCLFKVKGSVILELIDEPPYRVRMRVEIPYREE